MTYLEVFFLLQVLDFLTTLIGLRIGGSELSPFVSWAMRISGDPVTGLSAVKFFGFLLAGLCLWLHRARVLRWVNYAFAVVVLWNVFNILRAVGVPA
jgi:hypothetical protein